MLENGVSALPAANGRLPQVSGLCFGYDSSAPPGSRVTGAVRQAAAGSCTGASVDLTVAASYVIAENDFVASGGDGYPVLTSRTTTQEIDDAGDHGPGARQVAAGRPVLAGHRAARARPRLQPPPR